MVCCLIKSLILAAELYLSVAVEWFGDQLDIRVYMNAGCPLRRSRRYMLQNLEAAKEVWRIPGAVGMKSNLKIPPRAYGQVPRLALPALPVM